MSHFALLVEWHLPDDAGFATTDAALRAIADKIHAGSPAPTERITAYVGVPADVLTDAATAGQLVSQAQRLQLQPGDVVTITLPAGTTHDPALVDVAKATFPGHKVVFARVGTTVQAGPEA